MRPVIETISPEESAKRGMNAMRKVVTEQGQVMSAALENNHNLYHTNKKLRIDLQRAESELRSLRAANASLSAEVERLNELTHPNDEEFAAMKAYCERTEAANKALREEMVRQLHPELDTEARKAALDAMKTQKREIAATGLVPSEDWINATPEEREKMNPRPEDAPSDALDNPADCVQAVQ